MIVRVVVALGIGVSVEMYQRQGPVSPGDLAQDRQRDEMIATQAKALRTLADDIGDTGLGLRNHRSGVSVAIDDIAVIDYLQALTELQVLTGDLLQNYKLEVVSRPPTRGDSK